MSTFHPTRLWGAQQAVNVCEQHRGDRHAPTLILRDRDSKYGKRFDSALRRHGARSLVLPHRAPNMNAYAERMIQTIRQECLDHFLIFGTRNLDHVLEEFVDHYNTERPHQSLGNEPLTGSWPRGSTPSDGSLEPLDLVCRERLGGLIRESHIRSIGLNRRAELVDNHRGQSVRPV